MQREFAVSDFDQAGGRTLGLGAACARLQCTLNAVDGGFGDAVGQHIDHPAYRVAAIQQRRCAAHHFDPCDRHCIGWHRMVERQAGRVQRAYRALQDANAVAVQSANDGATGAGAEIGGTDPRHVADGLAQGAGPAQLQFGGLQGGNRDGEFEQTATQRICADDDFGDSARRGHALGNGRWKPGEQQRGCARQVMRLHR